MVLYVAVPMALLLKQGILRVSLSVAFRYIIVIAIMGGGYTHDRLNLIVRGTIQLQNKTTVTGFACKYMNEAGFELTVHDSGSCLFWESCLSVVLRVSLLLLALWVGLSADNAGRPIRQCACFTCAFIVAAAGMLNVCRQLSQYLLWWARADSVRLMFVMMMWSLWMVHGVYSSDIQILCDSMGPIPQALALPHAPSFVCR